MRTDSFGNIGDYLILRQCRIRLNHDEGLWYFTRFLIRTWNDSDVGYSRVRLYDTFQFGRGNLESFVFDQLFDTVDNVKVTIVVGFADVTRVQPVVVVDHVFSRRRVIQVAFHHLRSSDPHFSQVALSCVLV